MSNSLFFDFFRSCRRACCEKDNCNEKDIGEIIIAKEAVATLAPLMKEIVSTRANPTTTAPTTTLSHVTSATTVVTTSLGNSNSNLTGNYLLTTLCEKVVAYTL